MIALSLVDQNSSAKFCSFCQMTIHSLDTKPKCRPTASSLSTAHYPPIYNLKLRVDDISLRLVSMSRV